MTRYYVAPDGADEPTIWEHGDVRREPKCIVRKAELPGPHADLLWSVLVGVLTADDETVERLAGQLHIDRDGGTGTPGVDCQDCREITRAVLAALREGR